MGTELGDSSAISVALNCLGQSYRVGWMLLLGWNQLLWSLLPFGCWAGWERDLYGWGHLTSLLLLPSLKEGLAVRLAALMPFKPCFAQPRVVTGGRGQDVASWDHPTGDLAPGWCP